MRLALPLSLLLATSLPVWADMPQPTGPVLLTVGGSITEPNLPARGEDEGGLFGFLEINYDKAAGFDPELLEKFEQITYTIPYGPEENKRDITFSGPLLADVMSMAGAEGKLARPMAMDGYQAEISWESISAHKPIVATHADGKPMGIGGYGPAMIVFPPTADQDLSDTQASQQVWALIYIGVE